MKSRISKILYATDLSPNSAHAFRYALKLAMDNGARIVILHVIDNTYIYNPIAMGGYISEDKLDQIIGERNAETLEQVENRIESVGRAELGDEYDKVREYIEAVEIAEGFPAEMILSKADDFACDVIVMGTHGKGIISQTFLGSMAKRVLRRTRKPVFIVPLPTDHTDITIDD